MSYLGLGINTMTLGGLAMAIGQLVDDAIVDVENVFRRLKQNAQQPAPEPVVSVIFRASSEVRTSITFATLIIVLVFLPLLSLGGFEGRMFAPLAVAYVISIALSLLVALTVTPALCYYLLGRARAIHDAAGRVIVAWLKRQYSRLLDWTLRHPSPVIGGALVMLVAALAVVPFMGREFLPPFNEGTLNINANLPPGTSLAESNRVGGIIEAVLRETPEVVSTTRRTGRAERDEHAAGVNTSELEVVLRQSGRPHAAVMNEVREQLDRIPGLDVEVGQPISHRIDHLLSGTRAQLAIKLFGPDLATLRTKAGEIRSVMEKVPGSSTSSSSPRSACHRSRSTSTAGRRPRWASGLTTWRRRSSARSADTAAQVLEEQRTLRRGRAPGGQRPRIDGCHPPDADRHPERGPCAHRPGRRGTARPRPQHHQPRERPAADHRAGQRRRRDLGSVVADVRAAIARGVSLPRGTSCSTAASSNRRSGRRARSSCCRPAPSWDLRLLYVALQSVRLAILVMVNLPLALIGGVVTVFLSGGVLSIASLIGFITSSASPRATASC